MNSLKKTYKNGTTRSIEVLTAQITEDPDTVMLTTAADGVVMVCRQDDSAFWQELVDQGLIA